MSMQYTRLGRTGLQVSRLCLGTMTFGLQCEERTSVAIMDKAFGAGVTFFDTADVYPLGGTGDTVGRTEEIVGRWLHGRRDRIILATKCFGRSGPNRWDQGNSRKHILDAVDASLRRLNTDYIDLYQVQPRYNLLFREIERELLPLCREEGIGVIPYNPIAGGLLSGKHNRDSGPEEGSRFTLGTAAERYQDRYWHEAMFETVEQLRPIANDAGMALPQMAVAWVLANPAVTAPIIGASRPEQLDDTLKAAEAPMNAELKKTLDSLTAQYRRGDAAR
ncbi:MAG: aldo/keto reductase [Dehalococcoidia bacterium]|nr:aldo/keto reductase [Dehalococcoidia bacterium]